MIDNIETKGLNINTEEWKEDATDIVDEKVEEKKEEESSIEAVVDEIVDAEIPEEPIEEASTAERRAFKNGGDDLKDLEFGKALARIKDPHERAMLLHQHRMEKAGKKMSDRPDSESTIKRHMDHVARDFEKKADKMQAAGFGEEEQPLDEGVKISLDDLTLFKPWGGAKDIWELIIAQEKLEALDKALEDMYPEGITATDLNDILWFEKDWVVDTIDLKPFVGDVDAIEVKVEEPVEA